MKGPKILHYALLALAVIVGALAALEKASPAWAVPIAVVAGILTNLETVLQGIAARGAAAVLALLFLGAALYQQAGCAHVKAVANACEPSPLQSQQILGQLGNLDQAKALAGIDSLHFVECVVDYEIGAFIDAHELDGGQALLAASDSLDAVRLRNAKAWKAAHARPSVDKVNNVP